jgi:acylphosphatase
MRRTGFFASDRDANGVIVRAHVVFEGLVQGVFFRANTQRCASSLGLTGWVRNRADGAVEAVFEGEEEVVREAVEWCATKQPHARVDKKTVEFADATGEFGTFSIVY